jgi:hypothetical protein
VVDPEQFDYFRKWEPDARIGHALFVYKIPPRKPAPTWVAECTAPVSPIPPDGPDFLGFGTADVRQAYFDCTQSWLYPTGGTAPGWFAAYRDTVTQIEATPVDAFISTHLQGARLSYEQTLSRETPPFAIFEWPMQRVQPETQQAWPRPSTWPPSQAVDSAPYVNAPLALDGPLRFLGYTLPAGSSSNAQQEVFQAGQALELWTYWEVTATPERHLSLMAHLLEANGQFVAGADGLGTPITEWRAGDILVQRHQLALPDDTSPGQYWLQTGAYWLDTMERWPILLAQETAGDRLLLREIQVEAP